MLEFEGIRFGFTSENKNDSPALIRQVHGKGIVTFNETAVEEADGILTSREHQPIHVFTADCIPLLFFSLNPEAPIAAIHCGWRGAMRGIVGEAVKHFSSFWDTTHVIVGPSLLNCCFEVKEDFFDEFSREHQALSEFTKTHGPRTYFDTLGFVLDRQLKTLPNNRLHLDYSRCTFCTQPELPSFRRDKNRNSSIKAWIEKTTRPF